jgi:membrane protein implicated in regulation of membrane protease activity
LLAGVRRCGPGRADVHGSALVDADRLLAVYRPLGLALVGGAAAALVVGWARPAPWLLALLLVAILSLRWLFAVSRFLRADAWEEERSPAV